MSRKYETHMFTYRHDGAEWMVTVDATDADDARARIGKLAYASYDGVVHSTICLLYTSDAADE